MCGHLSGALNQAYLALYNGAPVGYLLTQIISEEGEIFLVGVTPSNRGQRIAETLIQFFLRDAASCMLEVRVSNVSAIRLYRRMGFEQIGTRARYYRTESGFEDALLFRMK